MNVRSAGALRARAAQGAGGAQHEVTAAAIFPFSICEVEVMSLVFLIDPLKALVNLDVQVYSQERRGERST